MFLLDLNPLRIELNHVQSAVGLNKLDWNLHIWAPDPAMNGEAAMVIWKCEAQLSLKMFSHQSMSDVVFCRLVLIQYGGETYPQGPSRTLPRPYQNSKFRVVFDINVYKNHLREQIWQ